MLDVPMVVPDSIEVVESYRTWNLDNGRLVSHNGVVWTPGEALHAECKGSQLGYEWTLVRYGTSLADAKERTDLYNQSQSHFHSFYTTTPTFYAPRLRAPNVEPPDGYGYSLTPVAHEVPHEQCTCGIYSGTTLDICPAGIVSGKVKLWGKVVPGEQGYRAEHAYPSEFIVQAGLAEDPALLAFGIPITVDERPPASLGGLQQFIATNLGGVPIVASGRPRMSGAVKFSIGLNVCAASLNLSLVGLHFLG